MGALRQLVNLPRIGARLVAAVLTVVALTPLLLRLPKVAVVACFGAGHPLYQLVPGTGAAGSEHCLTAPAPVVGWTLMIASGLLVQLFALPLILLLGALLVRGGRGLSHAAGQALTRVLGSLSELVRPAQRLVPIRVEAQYQHGRLPRENPYRGPPSR